MKFVNRSGNKRLDILCDKVHDLIYNDLALYENMSLYLQFTLKYTSTGVGGKYVMDELRADQSVVEVFLYTSKNPWSAANGYTLNDGKTQVFLNTRKLGRSDASILATLLHEAVHEADNNDMKNFYNHGDNYPKGGTAPEVIADVVYSILTDKVSTEDSSVPHKPWWKFW